MLTHGTPVVMQALRRKSIHKYKRMFLFRKYRTVYTVVAVTKDSFTLRFK